MGAYFDSPDRPHENACSGCGKFVANPAGGYQRKRTNTQEVPDSPEERRKFVPDDPTQDPSLPGHDPLWEPSSSGQTCRLCGYVESF